MSLNSETRVVISNQMVSYKGLLDLVGEIKRCERTGATIGALAVSFVFDRFDLVSLHAS